MTRDELLDRAISILKRTFLDTRTEAKIRLDIAVILNAIEAYEKERQDEIKNCL